MSDMNEAVVGLECDRLLEEIAFEMEQGHILDRGHFRSRNIGERRASYERESALCTQAQVLQAARLARWVRSFKSDGGNNPLEQLRRISDASDVRREQMLVDAWPLAWRGLVDISVEIKCNSNQHPPPTKYTISITDRGRELLTAKETKEGE